MERALNPKQNVREQAGQRVVLRDVSWKTYESLLADFVNSRAAHFFYYRGALEIMTPSFKHETLNRTIDSMFEAIAEGMELDWINAGSTTFKREELESGFEPDTCFYIDNAERIRGKHEIDLTVDPPPDLVIEVDTSHSLNKLPIYAAVGIPEVWRYNGEQLTIYKLENEEYIIQEKSISLPGVNSLQLSKFIEVSQKMERIKWLKSMRDWAGKQSD